MPRYTFGPFELDIATRRLLRDGVAVPVSARVFDTLLVLVEHHGRLVSKEDLIARVWGDVLVEEGNLARQISTVRKLLGESTDDPRFIVTFAGRGYQFVAPVQVLSSVDVEAGTETSEGIGETVEAEVRWRRLPIALAVLVVALSLMAVGALIGLRAGRSSAPPAAPIDASARFVLRLPETSGLYTFASASVAIAPDGSRVAYVADEGGRPVLFVQDLDAEQPRRIEGSEGARSPFFSPDGQWIAFGAGGRLKKVWLRGGSVQTLCDAPMFYGGTWGADGTIVFLPWFARGLWKVSADGGTPTLLAAPRTAQGERGYCWPQILPDGQTLLFTVWTGGSFEDALVAVQSLVTGERRIVHKGGTYARYAEPGALLVARAGALHALPFDAATARVTGDSQPVLEDLFIDLNSGAGLYDVARNGTLVFARGGPRVPARQLVRVDRTGHAQAIGSKRDAYSSPRLAADGRIAVWLQHSLVDVWLLDMTRDAATRVTHGGDDHSPVWSPDGLDDRGGRRGSRSNAPQLTAGRGVRRTVSLQPVSDADLRRGARWQLPDGGRAGLVLACAHGGVGMDASPRPDANTDERGTVGVCRAASPRVERGCYALLPGCGTTRRYGFSVVQPAGYFFFASSSDTAGTMITSSPCCQFTGVATW